MLDGNMTFGFASEADLLAWGSSEFLARLDVLVEDVSVITFFTKLVSQDGCCELCYSEEVRLVLGYAGSRLSYLGEFSYEKTYTDMVLNSMVCETV